MQGIEAVHNFLYPFGNLEPLNHCFYLFLFIFAPPSKFEELKL